MEQIIKFKSIDEYNKVYGVETLHPLVHAIDTSNIMCEEIPEMSIAYSFDFYSIFLFEMDNSVDYGKIKYGRNFYDYQDGTLMFTAPGQIMQNIPSLNIENCPGGWSLMFHPDLLRGTQLGRNVKNYSFFSYEVNEALHLSSQERKIILECFKNIEYELHRGMDNHTKDLIISNIELFLNYCKRFYERQFITRAWVNSDILSRFEKVLDDYFRSDMPQKLGLPTVKYCADKLNLSVNYLSDMLRRDTGKSTLEHIQLHLIETAKEKMFEKDKSVSQIAYELGFEYPQYFSRLFKKCVGMSPNEFRSMN